MVLETHNSWSDKSPIKSTLFERNNTILNRCDLIRVQEAAGSNPATPTKNPVTAFAVTGFLINGGIRKTGHSKARVVGESIGFRAHPGGA